MLATGADPNVQNIGGWVPLHGAQSAEVTKALLEVGADPNIKNNDGMTPLHRAKTVEQVQALLATGADPNVKGKFGRTPLDFIKLRGLMDVANVFEDMQKDSPACSYTSGITRIHTIPSDCRQIKICVAEVACAFEVGYSPNTILISQNYQASCQVPAERECPTARECVVNNRTFFGRGHEVVIEPEGFSGDTVSSSKGVR